MSIYQISKHIKQVGHSSRAMRWGRDLMSLSAMAQLPKPPSHYFFEFWCYLAAVRTVQQHIANVTLEIPLGASHAVWPMAPGDADNFSHFSFKSGKSAFGVFPGVEFTYRGCTSGFSPDVSIRSLSTKNVFRMHAMWDAKYRDDPSKKITRSEVYAFSSARRLATISVPSCLKTGMAALNNTHCFQADGIISNGSHSTETVKSLRLLRCSETARFGTNTQMTRP